MVDRPKMAVVGHTEWIRFARVDEVPPRGGIAHASATWEGPGGGGGVSAAQLAALAGSSLFFTALGDDAIGDRSVAEMGDRGIEVHAARRAVPTRTALTMVDDDGERTIVTLGERLEPHGEDPIPWDLLAACDGVYVTAGDDAALRLARTAKVVVITSRIGDRLSSSGIRADAVVGSARDPAERIDVAALPVKPGAVVLTEGADGGTYETADGRNGRYKPASLPGPIVDTYGAGDSFHAGLTYGLAAGMTIEDALELAARCGAHAVTGRGPTGGQLRMPST
jgi:ribokinase